MRENNSGFKIDESQRQSWLSIAAVWAGGMICVPCLMIGGVLAGGGLSLGQIVLSILIGYGLICAYMICIGMQACDTGLPVSVMASGALGETGARYIISTLLAIACVGWFGIQSATCGSAFASMVANMLGTEASPVFVSISSIVWGVIMLLTACFRFAGLKWLNKIAVPLLGIVLAAMMAIDMGGPFNKAAYVFGTSTLATVAAGQGSEVMAAVMVGGMVPPLAIALATTFFKNRFTAEERKSGVVNYIMGLCFITEGAIPFAAADPLHVLPACIVGSGLAGALSMAFGCALPAPHGGVFVFPVMTNVLGYLIALAAGSVAGMLLLGLLKKKKS